jgi:hypothetical protein
MSKKKKAQRGNLLEIATGSTPPERKAEKSKRYYGNPDEIRRRARQASYFHEWRERKQLELLGFDDLDN